MITDLHLKLEKRRYDEEATAKEEPLKRVVFSGNDGDEGGGVEDKEVRLLFLGEAKPKARTTQVSPMRGRANTPPLMSTPPPMTSGGADAPPNLRRGSIEQHIEQQHQGQKKEEGFSFVHERHVSLWLTFFFFFSQSPQPQPQWFFLSFYFLLLLF